MNNNLQRNIKFWLQVKRLVFNLDKARRFTQQNRIIYVLTFICVFTLWTACAQKNKQDESGFETEFSQNFSRIIELTNPPMNGQDIVELQNRLLALGFSQIGEADGYYGKNTTELIKNIQVFSGFESNGKVDSTFWNFIFDNSNDLLLQNISTVLTYDTSKLIKTRDLRYTGFPTDYEKEAFVYFSSTDLKVKILKFHDGYLMGWIILTCYFINNDYYFVKFISSFIDYDEHWDQILEEEKMCLVNNKNCFEIVNGVLRSFEYNQSDYNIIKNINDVLNNILDKKGTIKGYIQSESDFKTNGKGTITGYESWAASVVIPAQIRGVPVTTIGDYAFSSMGLINITIPNTVTSISEYAFENNKLESVAIPIGVTSIGERAFYHNQLTSITIGTNVTLETTHSLYEEEYEYHSFDNGFDKFYNANGKKAGTYVYSNKQWSMEE